MAKRLSILFLFLLLTSAAFAGLEVYPGPGTETYRSTLYTVEAYDGANWIPAYVYTYSRKSNSLWYQGQNPSVSFLTLGTSAAINLRISKIGGAIAAMQVSPKSKNITPQITDGQATITLNPLDKTWIIINGDEANPLFIFADNLKAAVPTGATYFGPGVIDLAPANNNHYVPANGEIIYLDGGAYVRGNFDVRGKSKIKIMGPGVLSGELWTSEFVNQQPDAGSYRMITGDWGIINVLTIQDITIVASPTMNISSGVDTAYNVKLLSPWYYSTDGFGSYHADQVFAFVGDNVFFPIWAGIGNNTVSVTNSFAGTSGNAVFCGGFWGQPQNANSIATIDNIDIKTYNSDAWVPYGAPHTPILAQVWVDNSVPTNGYFNQTYSNIRIEGNVNEALLALKNYIYPWGGANSYDPPLGNSYNFLFKNITLEGTQKYLSEVKGYNAANEFHGVAFENLSINGQQILAANSASFFDTNAFVENLFFVPLDSIAPMTAVTFPTGGTVGRGSNVTITATATDNVFLTKLEFYVNSNLICTDTAPPFSCAWTVPSAPKKPYAIQTKAYDISGNAAQSIVVNVTSK